MKLSFVALQKIGVRGFFYYLLYILRDKIQTELKKRGRK